MQEKDPDKLAALVVQTHAATRATFDIVRQLNELVPIESKEDFVKQARLSLGEEEISVEEIAGYLPEALFPIRDTEELVRRVAATIRVSGPVMASMKGAVRPAGIAKLLDELEAERAPVLTGVAHFGGRGELHGEQSERS